MQYQQFSSCEEVATILSDWDLDLRPLESGGAEICSASTSLAAINLTSFSGRVHQLGATPTGHYTIGILTTPHYQLRWNGRAVNNSQIEVFASGCEYDSIGPGGFSALTVTVDHETLDGLADDLGMQTLSERTGQHHWHGDPIPERFRHLLSSLRSHLSADHAETSPEDTLTDLLLALDRTSADRTSLPRRRRVFQRGLQVMNELPANEAVSIGAICRLVGCSFSTLERAFREQTGVGPKTYLLRLRLSRVHSQLRRVDTARITDIANQNGFWHMGKFAADYRQAFGELPSDTLSRIGN